MNDIRKLMETLNNIEEGDMWPHDEPFPKKPTPHGTIANDDAELYIARVAQALAKDAVEQAAGVYDEEGDGEGKFATGAKNVQQYVRIAAPRFLTKDYKKAIIQALQQEFDDAVQAELRNYGEMESVEEAFKSDADMQKDAAANELADAIAAQVISVMRSRPNGEKHREGMTNYIMKHEIEDLRRRVESMVNQRLEK